MLIFVKKTHTQIIIKTTSSKKATIKNDNRVYVLNLLIIKKKKYEIYIKTKLFNYLYRKEKQLKLCIYNTYKER